MFGIAFMGVGCCVVLLAIGLGGYGLYAHRSEQTRRESMSTAAGTVVELARRAGRRSSLYHPVVEFKSSAGETVKFESEFGSVPASHQVGQSVEVRYNPSNPQEAEVDSPMSNWLGLGIAGFMGVIAACLGLAFLASGLLSYTLGF